MPCRAPLSPERPQLARSRPERPLASAGERQAKGQNQARGVCGVPPSVIIAWFDFFDGGTNAKALNSVHERLSP